MLVGAPVPAAGWIASQALGFALNASVWKETTTFTDQESKPEGRKTQIQLRRCFGAWHA